jgi:phosphatidylinositol 3-kinase
VIWKHDDLRKDLIVSNVIRTMASILNSPSSGLNCWIPLWTYRVVPTSCSSGFIERIQDAETLENIRQKYPDSPELQYLREHNTGVGKGHEELGIALNNWSHSIAAWTVFSYLLGLGDRHLHNLMLSHNGVLFHIDYGFILGKNPKFFSPTVRFTQGMLDEFKRNKIVENMTCQIFLALRRHVPVFFNLLLMLCDETVQPPIEDLSPQYLQQQLSAKFYPTLSDEEAKVRFLDELQHALTHYGQAVDTLWTSIASQIRTWLQPTES